MANVICIPVATASDEAVVTSLVPDAYVNRAPITEAPVISPKLRERLSRPDMTPRSSGDMLIMTAVLLAVWNKAYPIVSTTIGKM